MTAAAQEPSEWHRLAAVSSLVDVVARHVDDLIQLPAERLPEWLTVLGVPAGWRIARLDGNAVQPSRIAVCSRQSQGGGEACETISVFRFTGIAPVDVVRANADCTLRDLRANDITAQTLMTPPVPGVIAVRSSGYFNTTGLRVWAQYSTYIAGSNQPGKGRLIQHSMFVESGSRAALNDDITRLSNAIHRAFLTSVGAR
ncbi:hypothetical protein MSM1_11065 [Mycobacterium sp. SM1]|uniref:hypothetical protein n=1 Tax=Mycobacterium sp. SM1 TaxID=2816243 RepID=UPI001BCE7C58|nr:hypothetical protein [Mycobacterium sp. SM1]MBS4728852.1 hypothetical protein [Mycobacterium sp. SM1]